MFGYLGVQQEAQARAGAQILGQRLRNRAAATRHYRRVHAVQGPGVHEGGEERQRVLL